MSGTFSMTVVALRQSRQAALDQRAFDRGIDTRSASIDPLIALDEL
jgi:hypothetical protein